MPEPQRKLLGMLTPSSNTTLEPVTSAMLAGLPETSAHFGRFKVTEIALSGQALAQFDLSGPVDAADERPEAVAFLCTNLRGAPLVPALERELGVPVYDSVATVVWKALRLAGVDTRRVTQWGRLFQEAA